MDVRVCVISDSNRTHSDGWPQPWRTSRGPPSCRPCRWTGLPPHPAGLCLHTAVRSAPPPRLRKYEMDGYHQRVITVKRHTYGLLSTTRAFCVQTRTFINKNKWPKVTISYKLSANQHSIHVWIIVYNSPLTWKFMWKSCVVCIQKPVLLELLGKVHT